MKTKQATTPGSWARSCGAVIASAMLVTQAAAKDIVDVLAGNPHYSTLVTAVQAAGLEQALRDAEGVTVLAPTNKAFSQIPEEVLAGLLADPKGDLKDILLYHVLPVEARSSDLSDGPVPTLLTGTNVEVDVIKYWRFKKILIDDSKVIRADIKADNGIIHGINRVLDPARNSLPTILDLATGNPDFSILADLVVQAGLAKALDGKRDFTVFAPNNAAFGAVPAEDLAAIAADPHLLRTVLFNHIARGTLTGSDLAEAGSVKTFTNILPIAPDSEGLTVDGVKILAPDVPVRNGVVHVVEQVLVPKLPQSLVDVATGRSDLSTFVTALGAAELASVFDSTRKHPSYTIFAPDNEAFAKIPSDVLNSLLADPTGDLADILKLHVVAGTLNADDLFDGQILHSLSGKRLVVAISESGVTVNGTSVKETDLEAANGVIHIVSEVLSPEAYTVADAVASIPALSTLNAALMASGLDKVLDDPTQQFTLLAPTNRAFSHLPPGTVESLLQDPEGALTDILTYHVIPGAKSASELVSLKHVPTVLGPEVTFSIRKHRFFFFTFKTINVNGNKMLTTDIKTDNGVIHIIGGVLLPPAS